jgi:deoxyhypusine monooxygenase
MTSEPSVLFKHEVVFIFGQIQSPLSVPSLIEVLEDDSESEMVHHEAADALGGIATDGCLPVLKKWVAKEDDQREVSTRISGSIPRPSDNLMQHANSRKFQ